MPPSPKRALVLAPDFAAERVSSGEAAGVEAPRVLPVEQAHLTELARCHTDCWVEAYRGLVPDSYLDKMSDLAVRVERWRPRLTEQDSSVHVAVIRWPATPSSCSSPTTPRAWSNERSQVVGLVWAGKSREMTGPALPELELRSLYVRRSWHGSGLASSLLRAAVADRAAWLWVFADNPRARAFYRRHGFLDTGECRLDVDTGVEEVRLARSGAR